MLRKIFFLFFLVTGLQTQAQFSPARKWIDMNIIAIKNDGPRPPVQARNLYHVSLAMYEAWALYDNTAENYLLGHTFNGITHPYPSVIPMSNNDTAASVRKALSYAAYRVLKHRYKNSVGYANSLSQFNQLMASYGYNTNDSSTDYVNGGPSALGNYIAERIILYGIHDGSNELNNYDNAYYYPSNGFLNVTLTGSPNFWDVNHWQPLYILNAADQNNNPIPPNQKAICPEWGNVTPFGIDTSTVTSHVRFGDTYKMYFDPGGPSKLDTINGMDSSSMHYKWAYAMVAIWSSMHDPNDTTLINISPSAIGNLSTYPLSLNDQYTYYNYFQGGDNSTGYPLNPVKMAPYPPNWVKRGDYTRVISQYWADGPASETPPGHWFVLLNTINESPFLVRKFEGVGPVIGDLEWDVKSYVTLGGALHDAAIATWAVKGWYDSPRPISVIRKLSQYGQSSDSTLPHYHQAGFPLIPGYIELVMPGDSLALLDSTNLYKIKIKSWRGFEHITDPNVDVAGVGWILGEKWWPYQRRFFVTPPFAGYVSGHSTYSRAGAEVLTKLTGSPYFPGGLYEKTFVANNGYLQLEQGPSTNITVQYASYVDASNEASLSRIYGGIHPPTDDAGGRWIGHQVAEGAFTLAKRLFTGSAPLNTTVQNFNVSIQSCSAHVSFSLEESNADHFEIWRSINGNQTMEMVSLIEKNSSNSYQYIDVNPGMYSRYELREVNVDGKVIVLESKSVVMDNCSERKATHISLQPNLVEQNATLTIWNETEDEKAEVIVNTIFGQIVRKEYINLSAKQTSTELQFETLKPGNYLLTVQFSNGEKEHIRFQKK